MVLISLNNYPSHKKFIISRTIIISSTQDLYFSLEDNVFEAKNIPNVDLRQYDSPWGHCVANPGNDPSFESLLDKSIYDLLKNT